MKDPLSGTTWRAFDDGAIAELDMKLQLYNFVAQNSKTLVPVSDLRWFPLQFARTSGAAPGSLSFRVTEVLVGGKWLPASIVLAESLMNLEIYTGKTATYSYGLSLQDSTITDQMKDPARSDFEKRNGSGFDADAWPYINVYINSSETSLHNIGRYWLTNLSAGDNCGFVATFCDARWVNMKTIVNGCVVVSDKMTGNEKTEVLDTSMPCVFNYGNKGNKRTQSKGGKTRRYFAMPTSFGYTGGRWKLSEMLQYLWEMATPPPGAKDASSKAVPIRFIQQPTTENKGYKLWADYGGELTPEISIEGMNLMEALDTIIKAAGNYEWTLKYDMKQTSADPELVIYERQRWQVDPHIAVTRERDINKAMPEKYLTLPTPGVPVSGTTTNVLTMRFDIESADRYGRVIVYGDPIIIESTFSTVSQEDNSCRNYNNASVGVQSLFWQGDEAKFQAAYNGTSGSATTKMKKAMSASNTAYRVVALTTTLTSLYNPVNGFGFMSQVSRSVAGKRPFLPYRLPEPDTTTATGNTKPGTANPYPDILVWIQKPGTSTWILMDDDGQALYGGWNVDPDIGGIRFQKPLVDIAITGTFTAWDVRVTACIEPGDRLFYEARRLDYNGETLVVHTENKYRKWIRWNSLGVGVIQSSRSASLRSEVVLDECDLLKREALNILAKTERLRMTGNFGIPWVELWYAPGDCIAYLEAGYNEEFKIGDGTKNGVSPYKKTKRETNACVLTATIDFQQKPYTTSLYVESEAQR